MNIKCIPVLALLLGMSMAAPVLATNGYFTHGHGTKNKALAGAGVALPQDAMIAATNPAGMVFVGDRVDFGAALFSPSRSYEIGPLSAMPMVPPEFPLAEGRVESGRDYFIIPHFGSNWMLSPDASIGLSLYGNGGMNTDYPASASGGMGTFFAGPTGVDMAQAFVNASYARKIGEHSAFGISVIFAYQTFEAKGLGAFAPFSKSPDKLTNRGTDSSYGLGFKLGWQGEVWPGLVLAASWQSEMKMSEFDDYAGLFAEAGDFDIPSSWTAGLAYELVPGATLVFDVQQIMYRDIASVGNPMMPALGLCTPPPFGAGDPAYCLGADSGPGFGWQDMTVYKLGYQWQADSLPGYTWRLGYSYGDQPVPESEVLFNILSPGVIEQHITFGMTRVMGDNELSLAILYAPTTQVKGSNPTVASSNQEIQFEMSQWELELSYSW